MYESGVPTFLEKPDHLIWDFSPLGQSLSGQNGSCVLRWVWGLPLFSFCFSDAEAECQQLFITVLLLPLF